MLLFASMYFHFLLKISCWRKEGRQPDVMREPLPVYPQAHPGVGHEKGPNPVWSGSPRLCGNQAGNKSPCLQVYLISAGKPYLLAYLAGEKLERTENDMQFLAALIMFPMMEDQEETDVREGCAICACWGVPYSSACYSVDYCRNEDIGQHLTGFQCSRHPYWIFLGQSPNPKLFEVH